MSLVRIVFSTIETVFGMQDNNQTVFDEVVGRNWELIRKGTKSNKHFLSQWLYLLMGKHHQERPIQ
jgi:hypothetical protein